MHLHANAAHHLMRGRKVTVGGEGSSVAWLQRGVKQIFNVSWIQHSQKRLLLHQPTEFVA